jgi:hypothetical protein
MKTPLNATSWQQSRENRFFGGKFLTGRGLLY